MDSLRSSFGSPPSLRDMMLFTAYCLTLIFPGDGCPEISFLQNESSLPRLSGGRDKLSASEAMQRQNVYTATKPKFSNQMSSARVASCAWRSTQVATPHPADPVQKCGSRVAREVGAEGFSCRCRSAGDCQKGARRAGKQRLSRIISALPPSPAACP